MMDDDELRAEIIRVVAALEAGGYNQGSTGNVSCRSGAQVLITPTGANSGNLTAGRLALLDSQGAHIGGARPSSEWQMHLAILAAFPTVQAVIHTHADACVALSSLRRPIPAFHYMIAGFGGGDIRCAGYATFGSPELAAHAVAALEGRKVCLLANHGMIALGSSLAEAFTLTAKLETLARQYIMACQAGSPVLLSEHEIAEARQRYREGYGRAC